MSIPYFKPTGILFLTKNDEYSIKNTTQENSINNQEEILSKSNKAGAEIRTRVGGSTIL
jgi:hypothetical protein